MGLLDDEGVVEEGEGLGGDGAAGALADGAVDVGEVEGFEEVEAFVAEGGGVEGAAGVGEDVVVFEVLRGAAVGVDGGGLDVGAEEGLIEGAGEGEDGVAEGVGVEAAAVGAPEEFVFGVFGVGGLPVGVVGGEGGELVGAGEDEAADEFFEGPAVGDEVVGEVVEEEGVGGGVASGAEVVDGADKAFTEEVHPDAVDEDAGGEGVLRVGDSSSRTLMVSGRLGPVFSRVLICFWRRFCSARAVASWGLLRAVRDFSSEARVASSRSQTASRVT